MPKEYEIKIKAKGAGRDTNRMLIAGGVIDLVESFRHSFSTKFSKVPLEDGASIVDHAIDEPMRIRLNIIVSSGYGAPQDLKDERQAFAEEVTDLSGDLASIDIDALEVLDARNTELHNANECRPETSLADLRKFQTNKYLLSVSSLLFFYDDMVIEKITARETLKNGRGLFATIDMRQIKFAKSVTNLVDTTTLSKDKMTPDEAAGVLQKQLVDDRKIKEDEAAALAAEKEAAKAKAIEDEKIERELQRQAELAAFQDDYNKYGTGIFGYWSFKRLVGAISKLGN